MNTVKLTKPKRVVIPSNLHVMLTGAWRLTVGARKATLEYTDGTAESVDSRELVSVDTSDWIAVVSKVQSLRGK